MKRGFGSDNHSGAHPRILEAIAKVNHGHMPSYGTDEVTLKAVETIRQHFGPEAEAHFVFNGTAANVLALAPFVRPYHSVLVSQHAHLQNDECGAPEKNLGAKLVVIPSADAKLTVEMIKPYLVRRGDQHYSQVRAISITQPTELGTLYTIDEIKAITTFAKKERLIVHMDGARLVNAAEALGVSLKSMTTDCGVDVVSMGGTKNGLLFGEAVVFVNPLLNGETKNFKFLRKQMMQLPSKTRFIAAQFEEFLGTELWRENARHANEMAKRLALGLSQSPYAEVVQKTEANAVFAKFPRTLISRLREHSFFYIWDEASFVGRLMTSWDTQPEDIDGFIRVLNELGQTETTEKR